MVLAMTDAVAPTVFVGGRLCLDFCNTREVPEVAAPDALATYDALVRWSLRRGSVTREEADRLLRQGARAATEAIGVRGRARSLRDALFEIFSAIAGARAVEARALQVLNEELASAMARSQIVPTDDGSYTWLWSHGGRALDAMLWPVTRSAGDLLTGGPLEAIRVCASPHCDHLFMDMSHNQRRRWCDMRTCGNRAKARRHYLRVRRAAPPLTAGEPAE